MISAEMLNNALGFLAMGVCLLSYLAKRNSVLCAWVAAGMALMSVHYLNLGAMTTAVLCLASALRSLAAPWVVAQPHRVRTLSCWVAAVLSLALSWWSWQGVWSFLPLAGSLALVFASFLLHGLAFRRALLGVEVVWAANALAVGSLPGVALAVAGFGLNLVQLHRSRRNAAFAA